MSMKRFGKAAARIYQELLTRFRLGSSYDLFTRFVPRILPPSYRVDIVVQRLPPIPKNRFFRLLRVAVRGNRGFRPFSSLSFVRKEHDTKRHLHTTFRSRIYNPYADKRSFVDRVRHTFSTNTRYNRDLISSEWPTNIDSYEFGTNIGIGCNAAVYSARLRNVDAKRTLSDANCLATTSKDNNFEAYPLAIKLMFNYQHHLNANDDHLWREMYAELVPLPNSYNLVKGKLGSFKPLPRKHPNVVRMLTAFVDRMPMLDDAREKYPEALPTAPFYFEFINPEPRTMFIVMKRYRMTLRDYVLTHRRSALTCNVMVGQLLEGIVFLYEHCIAHRDLKSDNILLEFDAPEDVPHLVISDFGCALATGDWTVRYHDDETTVWEGNPATQAPEIKMIMTKRVRPEPNSLIDFRMADTWAAGGLSYEIFTRVNPFYSQLKGESYSESDLPPLPKRAPPPMQQVIREMLRRDPKERLLPHIAANVMTLCLFRFGTQFNVTLEDCGLGQFSIDFYRRAVGKTMQKWRRGVAKGLEDLVSLIAAETMAARAIVPQIMSNAELQLRATFLSRIQPDEMLQAITYFIDSHVPKETILNGNGVVPSPLAVPLPSNSNYTHSNISNGIIHRMMKN